MHRRLWEGGRSYWALLAIVVRATLFGGSAGEQALLVLHAKKVSDGAFAHAALPRLCMHDTDMMGNANAPPRGCGTQPGPGRCARPAPNSRARALEPTPPRGGMVDRKIDSNFWDILPL